MLKRRAGLAMVAMVLAGQACLFGTQVQAEGVPLLVSYMQTDACRLTWEYPADASIDGFRLARRLPGQTTYADVRVLSAATRQFPCAAWLIKRPGQGYVRLSAFVGDVESAPTAPLAFEVVADPVVTPATPRNVQLQ